MKFAAIALLLASPALALNGGYLNSMGGGNAMKASSFMPSKSGYAVPARSNGSYLDQFAAPAPPTSAGAADISDEPVLVAINQLHDNMNKNQRATIDILKEINSSIRVVVEKAEARSGSARPTPVAETTELVSALEASAGPAPNTASYLSQMGGGAVAVPAGGPSGKSYAPTKRTW